MKKIKWIEQGNNYVSAFIGCAYLRCFRKTGNLWSSDVSIDELNMMMRCGPMRKSLLKAKEDAIRLACELLLDSHAVIINEMKNFDLLEDL